MKTSELFDVKGLATIVTGGASGIGLAYAEAMADNGARVALLDIDRSGLDRAVAKLKARAATFVALSRCHRPRRLARGDRRMQRAHSADSTSVR